MLAKEGGEIARELLHALALPDDPPSLLRGPLGVSKRVAWAEPLDLDEVKAVGRACDCTVNDVLMATAAGALRSYMIERGDDVDGLTLRATVPVNLRPLEHAKQARQPLRPGVPRTAGRRSQSDPPAGARRRRACISLKNSRQAIVAFGLLAALGMAPAAVQGLALELFSRKATAVATNVPGPQQPLYLAGCTHARDDVLGAADRLDRPGHLHPQLQRPRAFRPDRRRQADSRSGRVIQRFGSEFEKLLYLALMGNWDSRLDGPSADALLPEDTRRAIEFLATRRKRPALAITRPTTRCVISV